MKYTRVGYTETSLSFVYWLEHKSKIDLTDEDKVAITDIKTKLKNWLYSTSGYYDKDIKGFYFDFDAPDTDTYNQYMERVLNGMSHGDIHIPCFNYFTDAIKKYRNGYINYLDPKSVEYHPHANELQHETVLRAIENKRVLVISSFANLVKIQVDSGNCRRIYSNFPYVTEIIPYQMPYSYFNKGEDYNILETADRLVKEINEIDCDIVIISAGAYTGLFANSIDKDLCCIGGRLQPYFGIKNQRTTIGGSSDWWITEIPNEYKPENYTLIEGGCYW